MATTFYVPVSKESAESLHQRAAQLNRPPEQIASRVLEVALRELPVEGRYMVVDGEDLLALEKIFGGGSVLNSGDLKAKVERLAGITYGNVRMDFAPGQLEEIARRAERLSLTPEQLIERTVRKMEELFFTHLGVGAGA